MDFESFYQNFDHPTTSLDCGRRCAPYNQYGRPFCCDTAHAVPTAYRDEWLYLQANTDLWHLWQAEDSRETERLRSETPEGQLLIECLGHQHCQRPYRSITCRAFPFYPYISRRGEFVGLSYYWQYEDRCWVINNLDRVSAHFRSEFICAYQQIFRQFPAEMDNFRAHSIVHRRVFGKRKTGIPLLHRNGKDYLVSTKDGQLDPIDFQTLSKYGPYEVASRLQFADEKDWTP